MLFTPCEQYAILAPICAEKVERGLMADQVRKYLRHLREARGLSTRQLAAKLGCSQPVIIRFETGERFPTLARLWEIVQILEGDFGEALTLYCLDSGIPKEVVKDIIAGER